MQSSANYIHWSLLLLHSHHLTLTSLKTAVNRHKASDLYNINITFNIFFMIPATGCSVERSFLILKSIITYKISTISHGWGCLIHWAWDYKKLNTNKWSYNIIDSFSRLLSLELLINLLCILSVISSVLIYDKTCPVFLS